MYPSIVCWFTWHNQHDFEILIAGLTAATFWRYSWYLQFSWGMIDFINQLNDWFNYPTILLMNNGNMLVVWPANFNWCNQGITNTFNVYLWIESDFNNSDIGLSQSWGWLSTRNITLLDYHSIKNRSILILMHSIAKPTSLIFRYGKLFLPFFNLCLYFCG